MPVTQHISVVGQDERGAVIKALQTAAGISPTLASGHVDDVDVHKLIKALQTAVGLPVNSHIDNQDVDKLLIAIEKKLNAKTVTMTIASPAVVSLTAHGFVANQAIKFATTGTLPTGVTAGTVYYVSATGLTANTFEFSTSYNGTPVNTSGTQTGTQSVYLA